MQYAAHHEYRKQYAAYGQYTINIRQLQIAVDIIGKQENVMCKGFKYNYGKGRRDTHQHTGQVDKIPFREHAFAKKQ